MTENLGSTNLEEAILKANNHFTEADGPNQRAGDIELKRSSDKLTDTTSVKLFKPGTKATVANSISLQTGKVNNWYKNNLDDRFVKARTIIPGEAGVVADYNSTHNIYFTDTLSVDNPRHKNENAKTDIVRKKNGKEVYRFTSNSPELADKVASIAARKIIDITQELSDSQNESDR